MITADPDYATCGIGSLGHEDADAAVRTVLEARLDIPFWPQLPRRGAGEHMVVQAALNLGFLVPVDARGTVWRIAAPHDPSRGHTAPDRSAAAEIPAANAAGLVALERATQAFPLRRAKGQWIGPVTLLSAVQLETGQALGSDARGTEAGLTALQSLVVAQAQRLRRVAHHVDLWLDEPLLGMAERDPGLEQAARVWYAALAARLGSAVRLGIHTCAPPTALLFELGATVLSFDATSPPPLALWPHIARHLQRGSIAWGLVPAGREDVARPADLVAPLHDWRARCGIAAREFAVHSLVTPACGLASLDAPSGAARLAVTVECAQLLRRATIHASEGGDAGSDSRSG